MSVKVAVRVRPFNSRELKLNTQCVVDMTDPTTILKPINGQEERRFTFDFSFWSFDGYQEQPNGFLKASGSKYADQTQVFEKIGKNILDNAWQGYHCCLFAYGQTGSGKSYSMIGYGENKGIVPITCNQIFERIKKKEAGQEYEVSASMLEIYNEEIQDLTIPIKDRVSGGLKIRENKLLGVYVDGVKKHLVTSFTEIENVMEMGTKNRTVAATQMNATSSRAHTIICVEFKQIKTVSGVKSEKLSMINLVDLAGSERQDKTGATGQRLKQAVGINQSLTCLGQVISILAKNSDGGKDFVPYRNSALTRILENALGGNSQTIMICAISPSSDNYEESLSTLRYADQAKKIKNKPVVNETETDKLIRQLKEENQRLQKLMEGKNINVQAVGQANPQEQQKMKQREQEFKKKEEEMKKKQEQLAKKEKQQAQKLKDLEDQLSKKEKEKAELIAKQQKQTTDLENKLKQAQSNDSEFEKLKKELEEKKKLDEENKKKFQEQRKALQVKKSEEAAVLKNKHDEMDKVKQEKKNLVLENSKSKQDVDEDDEESIEAALAKLNEELNIVNMSKQEIKKKVVNDQEQLRKINADENILDRKTLKQKQKAEKTLPPYLENISKDLMINRKMKILLQKNIINIGKANQVPANDIVFGGRDVNARHATIHIIEQKVFLKPLSSSCHLYVNGKRVENTIELVNLDRVIFGWNSCYLFKNKYDQRDDQKIKNKDITWDFVRDEVEHLVDIDQRDDEDGGDGGCCEIF